MADRSKTPFDWVATFFAVVLGALVMAQGQTAMEKRQATVQDVRALELSGKLLDAELALPEEIRTAVGLDPANPGATGEADAMTPEARAVAAARETLEGEMPWSGELRLVCAAIAVAFHEDAQALALLAGMDDETVSGGDERVRKNLEAMARGRPAPDGPLVAELLHGVDASQWLSQRVLARHHANSDEPGLATSARTEAQAAATTFVKRTVAFLIVVLGLLVVGALLMLAWPLIRRALARGRVIGLVSSLSPFEPSSTQRVVAFWFVGYVIAATLLGLIIVPGAGAGPDGQTLLLSSLSLVQGGIALALIQRFGRRPGDHLPLAGPLRLSVRATAGSPWLLPVWILCGLAIAAFVTVGAMLINAWIFGDPTQTQQALELIAQPGNTRNLVILLTSVVIVAPVFEEILFRGFVYQNLRQHLGPTFAMIASGALFGLIHLEPGNLLPLSALGATLAFAFERSGTLWVPIGIHALWNLGGMLQTMIVVQG